MLNKFIISNQHNDYLKLDSCPIKLSHLKAK